MAQTVGNENVIHIILIPECQENKKYLCLSLSRSRYVIGDMALDTILAYSQQSIGL